MSTAIGKRMIDGAGVKYHNTGGGLPGKIAAAALRTLGTKAIELAANKLEGNGYKIAGEGRKRKIGRPTVKNATAYKKYHAKKKK